MMQADPELEALISAARALDPMTPEQVEAQRRSWVVGDVLMRHPQLSREEALELYERVRE